MYFELHIGLRIVFCYLHCMLSTLAVSLKVRRKKALVADLVLHTHMHDIVHCARRYPISTGVQCNVHIDVLLCEQNCYLCTLNSI